MLSSLFTSATGMKAQQRYVDNIANNLANVNTTGFKQSRIDFQDLIYNTIVAPGSESVQGYVVPSGLQMGTGVREVSTTKIFAQGRPEATGRDFDLAIQGQGFFQITHPARNETVYSRDGAFRLNAQGQLVTVDGFVVTPQITIPSGTIQVTIGSDGTVWAVPGSNPQSRTNVGQLSLVTFSNPAGLSSLGHNLYAETPASGTPTTGTPGGGGFGEIAQGQLEGSNVDVVTELVNLIVAQRAYEINSRAISVSDKMLEQANNVTR